jgi:hypothetical protein
MLGGVLLGIGALMQGQRRLWALIVPIVLGAACYLIGHDLIGAGAAVGAALFATPAFGRPVRPWSVVGAFLKLALLIALIAQAFAPSAAFMIEWPLLLITTGVLIASFTGGLDRPVALLACGIPAVLCLGWALGEIHMLTLGVGADLPGALGLFFWSAALALVPLIAVTPRPISLSVFAFTAAIITLGVIAFDTPATPRYPKATEVMYVRDADTGRFYLADILDNLDPWSTRALASDGKVRKLNLFPLAQTPAFVADAPAAGSAAPAAPPFAVTRQANRVDIGFPAGGPLHFVLAVRSDKPFKATLFGKALEKPVKRGAWLFVTWSQPPCAAPADCDKVSGGLSLDAPPDAKLEGRYALIAPGWPTGAKPLPPRPANVMAYAASDSSAQIGALSIPR